MFMIACYEHLGVLPAQTKQNQKRKESRLQRDLEADEILLSGRLATIHSFNDGIIESIRVNII